MFEHAKVCVTTIEAKLGVRSTWIGIGAVLSSTAATVAALELPQQITVALTAMIAGCGVIAVFVPTGDAK